MHYRVTGVRKATTNVVVDAISGAEPNDVARTFDSRCRLFHQVSRGSRIQRDSNIAAVFRRVASRCVTLYIRANVNGHLFYRAAVKRSGRSAVLRTAEEREREISVAKRREEKKMYKRQGEASS